MDMRGHWLPYGSLIVWRKATLARYNANKAKRLEELRLAAESGDPEAKAQYEEHCRKEEEKRERSKAYFKERYRKEQEKYKNTKALAEQGDPQAIELLAEYDRRIAYKKKQTSEREKANLSQMELSLESGVSQNMITYIENGKRAPTITTVIKLCNAIGISPAVLFPANDSERQDAKETILSLVERFM